MRYFMLITMALFIAFAVWADETVEHTYTVYRAPGDVTIDGVIDPAEWGSAATIPSFEFPWHESGETEQTVVRMLWDDEFLYLSYECEDKHIWAEHYNTNATTFKDDCVELFWNPAPEEHNHYYMFEINCIGNLLSVVNDHEISIYDNKIIPPHLAQHIQGTVNNDADTDTSWVIEAAIRFSDYDTISSGKTPEPGDYWRIGLNRCGGKTNAQYSQWSPSQTDTPNFHVPEDFGRIEFSGDVNR